MRAHHSAVKLLRSALAKWAFVAIPLLVAVLLAVRNLGWPFLWDDFDFLGRAQNLRPRDLFPPEGVIFYRPISREIYFWILSRLLGGTPLVAHVVNAAIAGTIVVLLVALVRRLAGARAGLISGLFFASSAGLPLAMGWISASQDLICSLFALVAFHLQLSRRALGAALAMAAAILSKETALALVPIPIVIAVLQRWTRGEVIRTVLAQAFVVVLWAGIHPWTRSILTGDVSASQGSGEYISFRGASVLPSSLQGLALTLNLRWVGATMRWTGQNLLPAVAATALIARCLLRAREGVLRESKDARSLTLGAIGVLTMLGAVGLTSLAVEDWSPLYACIPGLGLSMLAGLLLSSRGAPIVVGVLVTFLWLGVAQRDTTAEPTIPSELNFMESASALEKVERGFKSLRPVMPPKANVYVSVQARGHGGIYRQLFRFQPLRVWYGQPGIWVLDPNRYRSGADAEFLFWITPGLEVCEIDTRTLQPRGPGETINIAQYQKTLRGYAFGLTAAGKVDRAVEVLTTMPQASERIRIFDHRSAAMLLFSVGRDDDAATLLSAVPSFDRGSSVDAVSAVLVEPVAGLDLDAAAMRAFGLDPSDPRALHDLMLRLEASGSRAAAVRFAERLQALNPRDPESAAVLRRTRTHRAREMTAPIPYDVPQ